MGQPLSATQIADDHNVEHVNRAVSDSVAAQSHVIAPQSSTVFPNLAHNRVYAELLGSGATYSVNYERHISGRWSGRIGYSQAGLNTYYSERDGRVYSVPVTFSYLTGARASGLELGAGATMLWDTSTTESFGPLEFEVESTRRLLATAIVGYRYQPEEQGVLFRVGFTPFLGVRNGTLQALPWGGVSLGYVF